MSSPVRRIRNRVGVFLGVLLSVSAPVSCGGSSQSASTAASQNGATPAKSATVTSATGTPARTSGASSTPTAQSTSASGATASTPQHPASPPPGGHLLRRFTGYGNERLGTIAVHARSVLAWRASQPHIQIFTANGFMLVNSRSTTGTVRLSRGTYRGVRVSSAARWSVELRAPTP